MHTISDTELDVILASMPRPSHVAQDGSHEEELVSGTWKVQFWILVERIYKRGYQKYGEEYQMMDQLFDVNMEYAVLYFITDEDEEVKLTSKQGTTLRNWVHGLVNSNF